MCYSQDEESARQAALQTVVAGQQAENLLDFDDAPAIEGSAPTGLAAAVANTPGVAKVLTSSNPLDDLVSIFGSASLGGGLAGPGPGTGAAGGMGSVGSQPASNNSLGGLQGLSMGGMGSPSTTAGGGSNPFGGLNPLVPGASASATQNPPASTAKPPPQQQDDLLGLF